MWERDLAKILKEKKSIEELLRTEKHPLYLPNKNFVAVAVFDSARITSARFYECLQELVVGSAKDEAIRINVLSPSATDYYFKHYECAPTVQFKASIGTDKYLELMHWGPDGNSAESIATHAEILTFSDATSRWIVIGDQRIEMACLFVDRKAGSNLLKCIPDTWIYDWDRVTGAVKTLDF